LNEKTSPHIKEVYKQDSNELLKAHKPVHQTYKIGRILDEHGDSVLWVPPYYPGLNLIELILIHTIVKN
jgi:transposase